LICKFDDISFHQQLQLLLEVFCYIPVKKEKERKENMNKANKHEKNKRQT